MIASEALHRLGVTTSRTVSLIETGEDLYRSDEPSPTRSAVMVRIARTHLRFGTCERLLYLRDARGLERLLRHVVAVYYPVIAADPSCCRWRPWGHATSTSGFLRRTGRAGGAFGG